MNNLDSIISNFSPISLAEMDNVKLMSRTDTKFAFPINKLPLLLNSIIPYYNILTINGKTKQEYNSLYYDTDDRKFYLDHHNQRVNRNKIRFREYVGSNLTFLEVKTKNNKKRTIKKRIKVDSIPNELSDQHIEYIYNIIGEKINVHAKQRINFNRFTFVHKKNKERLTIDLDLQFKNKDNASDLKHVIIAEVKQERMSRSSDFMRIAKEMSILPVRLSKYCISTLKLNPTMKHNRFKKKLLFINKLKRLSC